MKSKNMVLLALAVGCGLVAAFLTAKLGAGNKQEMIPVLVAAKNLDQGTKLDKIEEQFVRKPFPKESVPPEYIDDPAQFKGKSLQRSVRAGSHITMADITPRNSIELPVDPKTGTMYKAMALRVAPETIVGGLVLPGSRVDVVSVERQTNGKTVAAMILQNVLVVGVDVNTSRPDDAGYIKNAQTVTLAVKQTEGMILALAQKRGDVMLMLRSPDDDKVNKNLKNLADYVQERGQENGDDVGGGSTDKTRVLVAKETIPAGTKITDPDKYFAEADWNSNNVGANFITKADDLRGRVVTQVIPQSTPPTKESFADAGVRPNIPADRGVAQDTPKDGDKIHKITFQVGGNAPFSATYRNGRLEDGGSQPVAPSPGKSPEIKPEKDDEKSDKTEKSEGKPIEH
jgi:Flp pilus assembly protein CpaB